MFVGDGLSFATKQTGYVYFRHVLEQVQVQTKFICPGNRAGQNHVNSSMIVHIINELYAIDHLSNYMHDPTLNQFLNFYRFLHT